MKKFMIDHNLYKGQVLPFVVLMMFVIIGMVALILDGGAVLSNRRSAQAAADAGALAGAQRICRGYSDWKTVAESYAIDNGASSALATLNGKEVTVVAEESNPSFFARIFGQDTLQASADATAGCFYPDKAKRVLPIAFYWEKPPVNASDEDCSDGECTLVAWDFDELMTELSSTTTAYNATTKKFDLPLDDIYVIMQSSTKICEKDEAKFYCEEVDSNESGGNRGFLDLNESNVQTIIQNGLSNNLYLPTWVNAEDGAKISAYQPNNFITNYPPIVGYESVQARLYFLPVFNKWCTDCSCEPNYPEEPFCDQANKQAYHIVGFGSFVLTCVQMNGKCEYGNCVPQGTTYEYLDENNLPQTQTTSKDMCPGLLATSLADPNIESSLEGYFVEEFPADQYLWGTEGVDVGVYLIDLTD